MTLIIITVVLILTVANSVAPKVAAGGSHLKLASYFGLMCMVSGSIMAVVPMVTGKIFAI